jgi:hypothetical protein
MGTETGNGSEPPDALYRDSWIKCTPDAIEIRGYYFPWGTKRIRYDSIESVRRMTMDRFRGKGRIWGTAHPRYWASLDPHRPAKDTALIIETGHLVRPFITPDDADAVEAVIREHSAARIFTSDVRRPFI